MGIFFKIYWLSSDKSNGLFTLIPTVVYDNTPLNYYSVEKIVEKIEIHILYQILLKKFCHFKPVTRNNIRARESKEIFEDVNIDTDAIAWKVIKARIAACIMSVVRWVNSKKLCDESVTPPCFVSFYVHNRPWLNERSCFHFVNDGTTYRINVWRDFELIGIFFFQVDN